jgi:GR25 family glycosyltransferase involved in LPS biosynthesis
MVRIDKMYYINLEHRTDRKEHMEKWIRKCVPEERIERIDAVYNKEKGYIGCTQSHIKALETFIQSEHDVCCIFEDDYTPVDDIKFWMYLARIFMSKIDFDLIQLSYNGLVSTETEHEFLVKPTHAQTASGYMITKQFAPKLLEVFKESLELSLEYEKEHGCRNSKYCCDMYWDKAMPTSKWYVHIPRLGYQIPSYSDIEKRHADYHGV